MILQLQLEAFCVTFLRFSATGKNRKGGHSDPLVGRGLKMICELR